MAHYVDAVLEHCEIRRAFDEAPHAPIAGISTASMFNGTAQADRLFLGDTIVLRAMDLFPKYPSLLLAQSENPQNFQMVGWACLSP